MPLPKLLETPFNFNLRGEAGENYTIVGKIDRVDPLNSSPRFGGEAGGAEIIDYKTGQGKTEATLDTDDKQQLLIYQLVTRHRLEQRVSGALLGSCQTSTQNRYRYRLEGLGRDRENLFHEL